MPSYHYLTSLIAINKVISGGIGNYIAPQFLRLVNWEVSQPL